MYLAVPLFIAYIDKQIRKQITATKYYVSKKYDTKSEYFDVVIEDPPCLVF